MKAKKFDSDFDTGKDITGSLDLSNAKRSNQEQKRVNVDFPKWMVELLDREAGRLGVTRCQLLRLFHQTPQPFAETPPLADKAHANTVFMEFPYLIAKIARQQCQQGSHLWLGTTPVLAAEGKQGKHLNTLLTAGSQHTTHSFHSGTVPGRPRQPAGLRPSVITVHDDRDMAGHNLPRVVGWPG